VCGCLVPTYRCIILTIDMGRGLIQVPHPLLNVAPFPSHTQCVSMSVLIVRVCCFNNNTTLTAIHTPCPPESREADGCSYINKATNPYLPPLENGCMLKSEDSRRSSRTGLKSVCLCLLLLLLDGCGNHDNSKPLKKPFPPPV